MYMHLEKAAPPLAPCPGVDVPPALNEALFRALAKRPEDRFASVREFAAALRASVKALPELPSAASPPQGPAPLEAPSALAPEEPPRPETQAAPRSPNPLPAAVGVRFGRRWLAVAAAGLGLGAVEVAVVAHGWSARRSRSELLSAIPAPPPEPVSARREELVQPVPPPPAPMPRSASEGSFAPERSKPEGAKEPRALPAPHGLRPFSAPAPAAKRRAPPRDAAPRETGEIAFTSKVLGKVTATVGSAKHELFANRVVLAQVPAGRIRVSLSSKDAGISCAVVLDVPANERLALVFGPEATRVGVRREEGFQSLTCGP